MPHKRSINKCICNRPLGTRESLHCRIPSIPPPPGLIFAEDVRDDCTLAMFLQPHQGVACMLHTGAPHPESLSEAFPGELSKSLSRAFKHYPGFRQATSHMHPKASLMPFIKEPPETTGAPKNLPVPPRVTSKPLGNFPKPCQDPARYLPQAAKNIPKASSFKRCFPVSQELAGVPF